MKNIICPSCSTKMKEKVEPDHTINLCKNCKSIFSSKTTIDIIVPGLIDEQELGHKVPLEEDNQPLRQCPKCFKETMDKITVYESLDTVLDYCSNCDGIFFDRDEYSNIVEAKGEEYYRKIIDGHLVKISLINGVHRDHLDGYDGRVYFINVSVYYEKPLNLGLNLFSEKTSHKLYNFLGIFNQQDIEVLNNEINRRFIIQGNNVEQIIELFKNNKIQSKLLSITKRPKLLFSRKGVLNLNDTHISYTEGPYRKYLTEKPYLFKDKKTAQEIASNKFPIISEFLELVKEMKIKKCRTKRSTRTA